MDLGLAGKTIIVTGGGSNIGRGIVLAFAEEKANIVNAEIDAKQGQRVVDKANALCDAAIPHAVPDNIIIPLLHFSLPGRARKLN